MKEDLLPKPDSFLPFLTSKKHGENNQNTWYYIFTEYGEANQ